MIGFTKNGIVYVANSPALAGSFTEEFRRVWGTYFPWIVIGSVALMVFALLKRLTK